MSCQLQMPIIDPQSAEDEKAQNDTLQNHNIKERRIHDLRPVNHAHHAKPE
jgi:hypothetical protein